MTSPGFSKRVAPKKKLNRARACLPCPYYLLHLVYRFFHSRVQMSLGSDSNKTEKQAPSRFRRNNGNDIRYTIYWPTREAGFSVRFYKFLLAESLALKSEFTNHDSEVDASPSRFAPAAAAAHSTRLASYRTVPRSFHLEAASSRTYSTTPSPPPLFDFEACSS